MNNHIKRSHRLCDLKSIVNILLVLDLASYIEQLMSFKKWYEIKHSLFHPTFTSYVTKNHGKIQILFFMLN